MDYTKEEQAAKIAEVAGRLGVPASWLDAVINFETAGTYSPTIPNPRSSAVGLIQLTDTAAREAPWHSTAAAVIAQYSDFMEQMDNVVYPYLAKYAPFAQESELWLAIFTPALRKLPLDTELPQAFKEANPGIDTTGDYVDSVKKRVKPEALHFPVNPTLAVPVLLIGAALIAWYLLKKRRR